MSKSKAITFEDLFNCLLLSIAAKCNGFIKILNSKLKQNLDKFEFNLIHRAAKTVGHWPSLKSTQSLANGLIKIFNLKLKQNLDDFESKVEME